jgi:hypothetical protein
MTLYILYDPVYFVIFLDDLCRLSNLRQAVMLLNRVRVMPVSYFVRDSDCPEILRSSSLTYCSNVGKKISLHNDIHSLNSFQCISNQPSYFEYLSYRVRLKINPTVHYRLLNLGGRLCLHPQFVRHRQRSLSML